jgi:hypothetical protein
MTIEFKVVLEPAQEEKLKDWQNAHKTIYGKFGNFVYSFDDNGINTFVEIKSKLSGQSISFLI